MLAYDSPRPREVMSCVSRLCKDYLYLYNSTTQRQLSATNPNSTTHNCNEHRRGCLLPSPIIISLAVTSVTAVNVSYDGVSCDRWGTQAAIVALFNYRISQCWLVDVRDIIVISSIYALFCHWTLNKGAIKPSQSSLIVFMQNRHWWLSS